MNNFIVSGKGFLEKTELDIKFNKVPVWTNLLRNAKSFTSKSAKNLINQLGVEAFVWNPYEEEATRNKWEVVIRKDYNDFLNDEKHNALEWYVRKVTMESKTDVGFLTNRDKKDEYYDSYEEAVVVANERNLIIIEELKNKLVNIVK